MMMIMIRLVEGDELMMAMIRLVESDGNDD